jgi:hypothetical protein
VFLGVAHPKRSLNLPLLLLLVLLHQHCYASC